jgi:hypothetical protein
MDVGIGRTDLEPGKDAEMSQPATRRITLELPEEQATEIESLLRHTDDDMGSHGRLDLQQLTEILLEDAF